MADADRVLAERLHEIVAYRRAGPHAEAVVRHARVRPKRQGRLLLPERPEVQVRYATLGFSDQANLDDGALWPTTYALTELTADTEAQISALIERAAAV